MCGWWMRTVLTPCEKTCVLEEDKHHCAVCGRTTQEIAEWSSMPHSQRKEIVKRLKESKNGLGNTNRRTSR
jgi:predicted Fe-S protein YdhL (DUF1289 family)